MPPRPTGLDDYLIRPDPHDPALSTAITGIDHTGAAVETRVIHEKPLTLYLNAQEIVTMMTIGDHPEELAIGYLLNQGMLKPGDAVTGVDVDTELAVVVVRTDIATNFESKLKKRTPFIHASGANCVSAMLRRRSTLLAPPAHTKPTFSSGSSPTRLPHRAASSGSACR